MRMVLRYVRLLLIVLVGITVTGCMSGRERVRGHMLAFVNGQVVVLVAETDDDFDEFDEFDEDDKEIVFDPLEGYNRFMFGFNDGLYVWVLRPASKGYSFVVPERARVSVKSFFKNLLFPVRFVNNALQFKLKRTGIEVARFGINSTLGLAGLFDPAAAWFHLDESDEDFGQTLGRYGVGRGFPIVLPIFGPSNLRDAFGMIPDSFLNPINYVNPTASSIGFHAGEKFNRISLYSNEYDEIMKRAVDPYIFFRDAYRQNRAKKVEK